jgi:hypothetical protein
MICKIVGKVERNCRSIKNLAFGISAARDPVGRRLNIKLYDKAKLTVFDPLNAYKRPN